MIRLLHFPSAFHHLFFCNPKTFVKRRMYHAVPRIECLFRSYCHYSTTRRLLKQYKLCASFRCNLERRDNFASRKIAEPELNIQKYLDHVIKEYESGKETTDIPFKIMDLCAKRGLLTERKQIIENIENLKQLVEMDKELKNVSEEEESIYKEDLERLDEQLVDLIMLHLDIEPYERVILEITAGIGGQEAMLFAKDLSLMYIGYLEYLGFPYEILEEEISDQGGIRSTSILVQHNKAFQMLKYEGGVHRVQRVPATERTSRMHTSTVTVAVLPEPTEVQISLQKKDLKIETKKASGAGGQHVNTTDSAVRITHLPTGTVVTCQMQRSQIQNRETALLKLRTILYEQKLNEQCSLVSEMRKKQQGMGFRNEKIRTYNYHQNRVTDHRLKNGTMYNLQAFMQGGEALEEIGNRLKKDITDKLLHELLSNFAKRFN